MNTAIARIASRRLLVDVIMVFLNALRQGHPGHRAFIEHIPHVLDTAASATLDLMTWRVNLALHTPAVVGKIVGRMVNAAKPNGPLHDIISNVVSGNSVRRTEVNAFLDVLESATVDVLEDITDVRSAAAALQMPVSDAIRITLDPKFYIARNAVQGALGN